MQRSRIRHASALHMIVMRSSDGEMSFTCKASISLYMHYKLFLIPHTKHQNASIHAPLSHEHVPSR
ncbi:predicted protein [Botrytis cinerea T4]|uniref:Uncharacterized protein n=1 Tax=Botryotinia fuckeliana (strain T4) TaxID=999810 RepID=G2YRY9_BOTF4|nr:predicted protein [Botrytis cinerea T4]